jgi:hypothetical protein
MCELADQGRGSARVVSRHLGHESIQTTVDVDGHPDRSMARAAATAIRDASICNLIAPFIRCRPHCSFVRMPRPCFLRQTYSKIIVAGSCIAAA